MSESIFFLCFGEIGYDAKHSRTWLVQRSVPAQVFYMISPAFVISWTSSLHHNLSKEMNSLKSGFHIMWKSF